MTTVYGYIFRGWQEGNDTPILSTVQWNEASKEGWTELVFTDEPPKELDVLPTNKHTFDSVCALLEYFIHNEYITEEQIHRLTHMVAEWTAMNISPESSQPDETEIEYPKVEDSSKDSDGDD